MSCNYIELQCKLGDTLEPPVSTANLSMAVKLPKFSDLPLNKGDPPYSAWGL